MHRKLIRRLLWMFVFVIAISAAVIYFTFDIRALEYLTMFEPWCIAAAFGILGLGLVFDGLRLMTLAAVTDEKLTTRQVVNVVLSNYFLALVTPGASGGAVAQIMFMRKAGVPVAKATVVVFVRTIMSITFLILLVPFVLHSDHALVDCLILHRIIPLLKQFLKTAPDNTGPHEQPYSNCHIQITILLQFVCQE